MAQAPQGIDALHRSVKITGFVAGVAQLVEQLIRNEKVEGSIPFTGTKNSQHLAQPSRWAFCLWGADSRHLWAKQNYKVLRWSVDIGIRASADLNMFTAKRALCPPTPAV